MNSVLQLKGQFDQQKNTSSFGPKNLPVKCKVEKKHIDSLINQLEIILNSWRNNTLINGALVSVHYIDVVAKSNRICALLSYKNTKSNDSIRGSKFDNSNSPKHIFTHYVPLTFIEDSIRKLRVCSKILTNDFNGTISHDDIELLNTKTKKYNYSSALALSTFIQIIIDAYFVDFFAIDQVENKLTDQTIVTLYNIGIKPIDLFRKLGINLVTAETIGDTTIRLMPNEMKVLYENAPYLIAMQVSDLSEITPETIEKCNYDDTIHIPEPTNEPTIGVIDTLFYEDVYFKNWVTYENWVNKNITVDSDDCFHGTAVTSIIVDGPSINPELDDGCGRFRVKHFGVATKGKFSSFTILKNIREIIAKNPGIKVWNLSLGSAMEIQKNFISPEAAELDRIQCEYDVVFVVAGTNKPEGHSEDMKIGAPADSLNSLVVNAVNRNKQPASYYRTGPVLSFFHKPDISYYGGDKKEKIRVCCPTGEALVSGTSFAAPWISRKMAYLIHNVGMSREVAKALIIDAAAGWDRKDDSTYSMGYGVVPIRIEDIINSADDEIKFYMVGSTDSYETYTYKIPVPLSNDKYPYYARATLCYFPYTSRDQGVDYTNTEMDIHFGRVKVSKKGKTEIKSINNNSQGDDEIKTLYEGTARELYRKWDNIKQISDTIKKRAVPRCKYESGNWGLSIKTKERLKTTRDNATPFGVVITLKEMNGVNRINEFMKLCMVRGWIVNRIDLNIQAEVYNKAEEDITFDN